ncbi:hypothetical protein ACWDWS_02180 [Streptomyces sp. NPDC003328]
MSAFPRYGQDATWDTPYIDFHNVPKESVTVTVTVTDEKAKAVIEKRLRVLKESKQKAINAEMWSIVYRLSLKITILEDILKEIG